jgi:hypothetical protein
MFGTRKSIMGLTNARHCQTKQFPKRSTPFDFQTKTSNTFALSLSLSLSHACHRSCAAHVPRFDRPSYRRFVAGHKLRSSRILQHSVRHLALKDPPDVHPAVTHQVVHPYKATGGSETGVDSARNRKRTTSSSEVKGRPLREADNLTSVYEPTVWENGTLHKPTGLHGLLQA